VWDGLPEELKTLFATQTSQSELEVDDPRERNDDIAVGNKNESVDPNYTLLKLTLALEARVKQHMERLEAGLALGEVMGVLKMVRRSLIYAPFVMGFPGLDIDNLVPCNRQTKP
jgi:hypothetical protein